MPNVQTESVPPLRARTLTPAEDGKFVRLEGWERSGPAWLVLYATDAADGIVWVSTEAETGNATATTPDRRPLYPPASFYLGPYSRVAVGTTAGETGATITLEITPHPVQPVRVEEGRAARCET